MTRLRNSTGLIACSIAPFTLFTLGFGQEIAAVRPEDSAEQASESVEQELSILYTKTNLSIAELELQRALELNKDSQEVIPKLTIERLRSNLTVAQEQYRQAKLASSEGPQLVRLRHAEERARLARVDWETAKKMQEKNAISDWEFKRLKLKYDLATLNLALLKHPKGYATLVDNMQNQIDRLGEDFILLEQRVAKLEGSQLSR